jgi:riboflavin kinase/FMN adenylyltransferase
VRAALARGDLERAPALLGRPYAISGRVRHGEKRGRSLGFPDRESAASAQAAAVRNLRRARARLGAPRAGVSRAWACVPRSSPKANPSRGLSFRLRRTASTGHRITVEFLHKLRDEEKYDSLDALTDQIRADVAQAREYFERPEALA